MASFGHDLGGRQKLGPIKYCPGQENRQKLWLPWFLKLICWALINGTHQPRQPISGWWSELSRAANWSHDSSVTHSKLVIFYNLIFQMWNKLVRRIGKFPSKAKIPWSNENPYTEAHLSLLKGVCVSAYCAGFVMSMVPAPRVITSDTGTVPGQTSGRPLELRPSQLHLQDWQLREG